jgi:hypothetical protein
LHPRFGASLPPRHGGSFRNRLGTAHLSRAGKELRGNESPITSVPCPVHPSVSMPSIALLSYGADSYRARAGAKHVPVIHLRDSGKIWFRKCRRAGRRGRCARCIRRLGPGSSRRTAMASRPGGTRAAPALVR